MYWRVEILCIIFDRGSDTSAHTRARRSANPRCIYIMGLHNNSHWIPRDRFVTGYNMSCLRSAGMIHSADSYVRAPCIHRAAFIALCVRTYNLQYVSHHTASSSRASPKLERLGEKGGRERERERTTMRLRYKLPAGNELCPCTARRDVSSAVSRRTVRGALTYVTSP